MNSLHELSLKIETVLTKKELKKAILSAMDKADSIEELLILKWHFNKSLKKTFCTIKKEIFYKNVERIAYQNALNNNQAIIEDLKNGFAIEEIEDNYNTTASAIKRILINCLENGEDDVLELVPKVVNINILPEQDRDFLCAKTTINMFIQANTVNIKETKAKFYSPEIDYNNYIAILENRNHPLFFQFQKLNQEHFSKTYKIRTNMNIEAEEKRKNKRIAEIIELEPQEIIKILSNVDTEEFELFCKAFNLSVRFFTNLIISNSTIKYEFTNKDTIREIYAKYKLEYKEIIEKVIEEICSLKESEFKEPLNLYEYYSHNSIDINYLARMALDYSDIKYRSLILKYIDIFKDPFSPINESAIESTKRIGIISCCSSSIKFTTSDITKAFKDMNEKDLPYIKGVLYGAIKKQQELKETKIKTKL